jgi:hypothetical protein
MSWWWWTAIGIWVGGPVVFLPIWALLSQIRKHYEAEQDHRDAELIALECVSLLRYIAVQSFMNHHHGTFQAWAERMGQIHVRVGSESFDPYEEQE